MRYRYIVLSLMLAMSLAACGSTQEDRGLSGAGIGAAAGAVVGAVTGLSIVQGVVIGAVAGGATGLLTDKSQVNLGDPVWKKGDKAEAEKAQASAGSETVRDIQSGLGKLGYDAGPADGKTGPKTRAAIRQYQERNSLLVDGQPSDALLAHIQKQI
jgi:peptidoglycan hydrolase-like protein with peptidoglycan-binding domain